MVMHGMMERIADVLRGGLIRWPGPHSLAPLHRRWSGDGAVGCSRSRLPAGSRRHVDHGQRYGCCFPCCLWWCGT